MRSVCLWWPPLATLKGWWDCLFIISIDSNILKLLLDKDLQNAAKIHICGGSSLDAIDSWNLISLSYWIKFMDLGRLSVFFFISIEELWYIFQFKINIHFWMQFLMTHFICSFLKDGLLELNKLLSCLNLLMSQETYMMRNAVTLLRSILPPESEHSGSQTK